MRFPQLSQTILTPATRQGKLFVKIAGVIIGLACVLHLVMGANPIIVCSAGLTAILSIYPVAIYGFLNIAAVLVALVGFRYVDFPLIAKLFMGQALDTNLMEPLVSFNIVLVGLLGYLAALQLASRLSVGKPLLRIVLSKAVLSRISFVAAIIGLTANFSVALRIDQDYTGLSIAESFIPFLHLALVSAIARVIQGSKGKRIIDWWVVILSIFEIAFAMVQNSRMAVMDTFLCFLITIISFKVKVKCRQVAATVCIITIMVVFVTPIFLGVRDFRDDLSGPQRIDATLSMIVHWPEAYANYQKQRELVDRLGWYLNYYGSPRNVLERMTLINHVDVLAEGSKTYGIIGFRDLRLSFIRAMPRIIAPNKPIDYGHGSWIYEKVGLFNLGPFATAPLIGTAFAAFGWSGTFFYPLLLGLLCFLIIKKISGWDLQSNIWPIYLLIRIHNQFVEGSSDAYIINSLRCLPQDLVLLWIIEAVARGRFMHSKYRKIAPSYGE